jgi:hypothetical protein
MTLEEQFREILVNDPRYLDVPGERRARGLFMLGAQATLMCVHSTCGDRRADREALIAALERVNDELGAWLGVPPGGGHATH